MILSENSATFQDHAKGREASLVGRPDFKSGKGREPVLGGFDSHSLPPTIVTLFGTKADDIWLKTQAGSPLVQTGLKVKKPFFDLVTRSIQTRKK
jgi:hypothetical protein